MTSGWISRIPAALALAAVVGLATPAAAGEPTAVTATRSLANIVDCLAEALNGGGAAVVAEGDAALLASAGDPHREIAPGTLASAADGTCAGAAPCAVRTALAR